MGILHTWINVPFSWLWIWGRAKRLSLIVFLSLEVPHLPGVLADFQYRSNTILALGILQPFSVYMHKLQQ